MSSIGLDTTVLFLLRELPLRGNTQLYVDIHAIVCTNLFQDICAASDYYLTSTLRFTTLTVGVVNYGDYLVFARKSG